MLSHVYILYKVNPERFADSITGRSDPCVRESLKIKVFDDIDKLRTFTSARVGTRESDLNKCYYIVSKVEDHKNVILHTVASVMNIKHLAYQDGQCYHLNVTLHYDTETLSMLACTNKRNKFIYPSTIALAVCDELLLTQLETGRFPSKLRELLLARTKDDDAIFKTAGEIKQIGEAYRFAINACPTERQSLTPWQQSVIESIEEDRTKYKLSGKNNNLALLLCHDNSGRPAFATPEMFQAARRVANESFVSKYGIETSAAILQRDRNGVPILTHDAINYLKDNIDSMDDPTHVLNKVIRIKSRKKTVTAKTLVSLMQRANIPSKQANLNKNKKA